MALALHNTLSGRVEPFEPLRAGAVGLYVCGVTVYDRCHVGHARSLVFFDTLVRYLRFTGRRVRFVRNITDIDDKIIKRAHEEGIAAGALAARYIEAFHRDVAALGCLAPDVEPRATDHVPDMIELVRKLEARGLAYAAGGDVYFAVARFPAYGKLSKRRLDELQAGARVEVDERKRDALDFALWKAAKPDEPFWESPWGPGRPGWHLECSAMSTRYLGQPFDLHGGGEDLIFPHHENEIAQSEGATGEPFVRHWIHHAFVRIDDEKMSKSLGNILAIEDIVKRVPPEAVRLFLVATHYRSPVDFTEQALADAQRACARLHETVARLEDALGGEPGRSGGEPRSGAAAGVGAAVAGGGAAGVGAAVAAGGDAATEAGTVASFPEGVRAFHDEFVAAMDDDLNTARALGVVFEEIREINRLLDAGERGALAAHHANVARLGGVLGVLRAPARAYVEAEKGRRLRAIDLDVSEIERLIAERAAARKARDFTRADAIRNELLERGIALKDGAEGTTWSVVQG
jgi:cysteinyl-tRNA synthetase